MMKNAYEIQFTKVDSKHQRKASRVIPETTQA
jgi:hypothetical protein